VNRHGKFVVSVSRPRPGAAKTGFGERVLKKFYRADGLKNGGLGLGLSIARGGSWSAWRKIKASIARGGAMYHQLPVRVTEAVLWRRRHERMHYRLIIDDETQDSPVASFALEAAGSSVSKLKPERPAWSEIVQRSTGTLLMDRVCRHWTSERLRRLREWADVPVLFFRCEMDAEEKVARSSAGG